MVFVPDEDEIKLVRKQVRTIDKDVDNYLLTVFDTLKLASTQSSVSWLSVMRGGHHQV